MSAFEQVCAQQRDWARQAGKALDARDYFSSYEDNLLMGRLSGSARGAFDRGKGSELEPSNGAPPKMCASHSSSALVVNVFDYWTGRDLSYVTAALGLPASPESMSFEEQLATGPRGSKAHLDLFLTFADASVVGVESKFTEWMKASKTKQFKPAYFPKDKERWQQAGLPRAQELAEAIQAGSQSFSHLDAAQLLKHMLALSSRYPRKCSLYYLYYDWDGTEGQEHAAEVAKFQTLVEGDMPFFVGTYSKVFERMKERHGQDTQHAKYLADLDARYFAAQQVPEVEPEVESNSKLLMSTEKKDPFAYWVDPSDIPKTPEWVRSQNSSRFDYWKSVGRTPEELTGDFEQFKEPYAKYLIDGTL